MTEVRISAFCAVASFWKENERVFGRWEGEQLVIFFEVTSARISFQGSSLKLEDLLVCFSVELSQLRKLFSDSLHSVKYFFNGFP
jgi:hypothetical protein